mmetsp:Transcript_16783/g.22636  ORF Transcript_16783/g.22636 Transcript_16783/m.22636 type:complete len:131 (-) Transcript_16783:322-714(-)
MDQGADQGGTGHSMRRATTINCISIQEEDSLHHEKEDLCIFLGKLGDLQLLKNAKDNENWRVAADVAAGKHTFRLKCDMVVSEFLPEEGLNSVNRLALDLTEIRVTGTLRTIGKLEQIFNDAKTSKPQAF